MAKELGRKNERRANRQEIIMALGVLAGFISEYDPNVAAKATRVFMPGGNPPTKQEVDKLIRSIDRRKTAVQKFSLTD